ncbi:ion transporter [Piscinibacter koreensis]|uniref:ion transporter n=1 Tax=Piscinibacter koreensis TaxID=2742824 RepID=UPI0031594BAF
MSGGASAAEVEAAAEIEHAFGRPESGWRRQLYRIVFESDTPGGRAFDLVLIGAILVSVGVVVLDSMQAADGAQRVMFERLEWAFTLLFTLEYVARLLCVRHPLRYATSLFGVIDLVAVLPTYLAFFFPDLHALIDVRILRLLRIFRILKMSEYIAEYRALGRALAASRRKIFIFLSFVLMVVLVMGTLMYVIEGPQNGFTSIPVGMYWAIVTMTTVGFGDITPKTELGRFVASFQMLLGWGILAVPTGIVSAEFTAQRFGGQRDRRAGGLRCARCGSDGHEPAAAFCKDCGARLPGTTASTDPR